MANGNGVSINIKTVAATLTVAVLLSGIIGNYFVTGYRIGELEKDNAELEEYIEAVDTQNNNTEKMMLTMQGDIKYIRGKLDELSQSR